MGAIGGYFELELRKDKHYHKTALRLNTARNCFEYVLRARGYKKVYMPFYTCGVMFQPLDTLGIECEFYNINLQFEIIDLPELEVDSALLYTNYFSLKQDYIKVLAGRYGSQLIVDNAHAFYVDPLDGIDTFYSARKFFGVPDGAYLYTDCLLDDVLEQDISIDRMSHLLKRIEFGPENGYDDFRRSEDSLDNQPIKRMSKLSEVLLCNIDYKEIAAKRCENFDFIHSHLKDKNEINVDLPDGTVPMCYPYLISHNDIRQILVDNKVFIPTYWEGVTESQQINISQLQRILPLPIDQRNTLDKLSKILYLLEQCIN